MSLTIASMANRHYRTNYLPDLPDRCIPRVLPQGYWPNNTQSKIAKKWLRWMAKVRRKLHFFQFISNFKEHNIPKTEFRMSGHRLGEKDLIDGGTVVSLDGYYFKTERWTAEDLWYQAKAHVPIDKGMTVQDKITRYDLRKQTHANLIEAHEEAGTLAENENDRDFRHYVFEFYG